MVVGCLLIRKMLVNAEAFPVHAEVFVAERQNQHFVPQYYFRFFSENGTQISSILKKDGRFIPTAPIRRQCAGHKFYGSTELESDFSALESKHAKAHRAAIDVAWNNRREFFSDDEYRGLLQVIMFQRSRTLLEIEKQSPFQCQMLLDVFRDYLVYSDDVDKQRMLDLIDSGAVKITEPPQTTILRIIEASMDSVPLIADLDILLLRNRTDYPFIFGDAPVVFYNTWAKNVKNRGVIGTQSPGLQIFYPLDPKTYLVLFDPAKYSGEAEKYSQYDLHHRSDVSSLNVLQLYHSSRSIYFGPGDRSDYVLALWDAHKNSLTKPRAHFDENADFLVDGKWPDGQLMHSFQPQIEYDLKLSFFDCVPISQQDYVFCRRSPEFVKELDRQRELRCH
jgi:hypothetical protein